MSSVLSHNCKVSNIASLALSGQNMYVHNYIIRTKDKEWFCSDEATHKYGNKSYRYILYFDPACASWHVVQWTSL